MELAFVTKQVVPWYLEVLRWLSSTVFAFKNIMNHSSCEVRANQRTKIEIALAKFFYFLFFDWPFVLYVCAWLCWMLKQDRKSTTNTLRLAVLLRCGGEVLCSFGGGRNQVSSRFDFSFFTSRGMVLCEAKSLASQIKFNEKVILENEKHYVCEMDVIYLRNKCWNT